MASAPPTLDPIAAARWQRAVPEHSPWLHEEVGRRMAERLAWIRLRPSAWLHWRALHGGLEAHRAVATHYPRAQCWLGDDDEHAAARALGRLTPPWWQPEHWRAPRPARWRPGGGGVDMVWANMALHHCADPQALITLWRDALADGGFLMFSCLGPDSLGELRQAYADAGWAPPAQDFTDMHDWGDMLVASGFAEPVMDMERITLTFATPQRLLQELRGLGRNLHPARGARTRGRGWLADLHELLAQRLASRSESGRLSLSFEVIHGHALKAAPRMPRVGGVSLEQLRGELRGAARQRAGMG